MPRDSWRVPQNPGSISFDRTRLLSREADFDFPALEVQGSPGGNEPSEIKFVAGVSCCGETARHKKRLGNYYGISGADGYNF